MFSLLLLCVALAQYTPDWASLDSRPIPAWYDQAKFGLFIHWGVYSVPAWSPVGSYAEWYWNSLEQPGSAVQAFHNKTYGPNFQYADFVDRFTAELFDPDAWADLFVRSGAKYIVPTSKHHEGWTLWQSPQSWNWNAVDNVPHMDLLGAILNAVRSRGLHPALYYSLYEWYNPLYRGDDPESYVTEVMLPQLYDVVNRYKPDLIFSDGEWEQNSTFWQTPTFLAWLFNSSPVKDTVVINDRWGSDTRGVHGGYYTPEYSSDIYHNHKWEENEGIDVFSFGFNRATPADQYQSAKALIDNLIRCVCNGGNLLLDIGPNWDGRIPAIMQERLLQIGGWLGVNGEAIYNTTTWRAYSEVVILQPVAFQVFQNQNNIYGAIPGPGQNSTDGTVIFYGNYSSANDCQGKCSSLTSCLSYTWHDSTTGAYAMGCYGRNTPYWSPTAQSGHVSGQKNFYSVSYTTHNPAVYAIVSVWPEPKQTIFLPTPIPSSATTVRLLGGDGTTLQWSGVSGTAGITITPPQLSPSELPCQYNWAFRLDNVK